MAKNIKISPDQALFRAGEIEATNDILSELTGELDRIILTELEAEWDGDTQDAFAEQYTDIKNGALADLAQLIIDVGAELRQVASNMETLDTTMGGKIRGK